jgi:hypothetical protein
LDIEKHFVKARIQNHKKTKEIVKKDMSFKWNIEDFHFFSKKFKSQPEYKWKKRNTLLFLLHFHKTRYGNCLSSRFFYFVKKNFPSSCNFRHNHKLSHYHQRDEKFCFSAKITFFLSFAPKFRVADEWSAINQIKRAEKAAYLKFELFVFWVHNQLSKKH